MCHRLFRQPMRRSSRRRRHRACRPAPPPKRRREPAVSHPDDLGDAATRAATTGTQQACASPAPAERFVAGAVQQHVERRDQCSGSDLNPWKWMRPANSGSIFALSHAVCSASPRPGSPAAHRGLAACAGMPGMRDREVDALSGPKCPGTHQQRAPRRRRPPCATRAGIGIGLEPLEVDASGCTNLRAIDVIVVDVVPQPFLRCGDDRTHAQADQRVAGRSRNVAVSRSRCDGNSSARPARPMAWPAPPSPRSPHRVHARRRSHACGSNRAGAAMRRRRTRRGDQG